MGGNPGERGNGSFSSSDINVESVGIITRAAFGDKAIADTRGLNVTAVLGNGALNKESLNSYNFLHIPDLSSSGRTEATEISFSTRHGQQGLRSDDRACRDDSSTRQQGVDYTTTVAAPTATERGDIAVMLSALKSQEEWEEKVDEKDQKASADKGERVDLALNSSKTCEEEEEEVQTSSDEGGRDNLALQSEKVIPSAGASMPPYSRIATATMAGRNTTDSSRMDNSRGGSVADRDSSGIGSGLPPPAPPSTNYPSEMSDVRSRYSAIGFGDGGNVGLRTVRNEAPPLTLRRQGAMSDLWQHQASFRTNRRRMKSVFEEFAKSLELPENDGKCKAEIDDIFTFTSVGYKHLVTGSPSEDRIAIHQAVTPTIDEATKEELEIDSIDSTPFAMFAVFDGHGGPACAEFLNNSVSTVLAHSPVLYDEDLAPFERRACATADSFTELEKVHNEWARRSGDLSGSTAILSTFQDGVLVMAGVGDSAGLYVDHEGNRHTLCPQHSTSNAREVERVLNMGGTITNGRVAGCLMPTRTLGDLDCKQALGDIVSPHPEIKLAAIYASPDNGKEHNEPFLVLASDGLWDVLSNSAVTAIVQRSLRKLRAKKAKKAAKQEKAKNSGGRFNMGKKKQMSAASGSSGSSRSTNNLGESGAGSLAQSEPRSSRHGKRSGGLLDRFIESGGKGDEWDGKFLDLSTNARGLDASVRGENGVGNRLPSAGLDESRYAGLRATGPIKSLSEADEDADGRPSPQLIAFTSTAATTGVRTVGTANDNPAMHLVHAATHAHSKDDISVVVVTFKAGNDKTKPGSRGRERRGSRSTNRPSTRNDQP